MKRKKAHKKPFVCNRLRRQTLLSGLLHQTKTHPKGLNSLPVIVQEWLAEYHKKQEKARLKRERELKNAKNQKELDTTNKRTTN